MENTQIQYQARYKVSQLILEHARHRGWRCLDANYHFPGILWPHIQVGALCSAHCSCVYRPVVAP